MSTQWAAEDRATVSTDLRSGDALVLIDVQNDFLPGGALAVRAADEVLIPLNRCIEAFVRQRLPVFATRDWHPVDHCSFRAHGGPWPPHCVAGTWGARFSASLRLPPDAHVISKASLRQADAYSGFQGTELLEQLRAQHCTRLFVGGLATDYCVRATVLDAIAAGFQVVVLADAVRAVDAREGDGERALAEVRSRGALLASSEGLRT